MDTISKDELANKASSSETLPPPIFEEQVKNIDIKEEPSLFKPDNYNEMPEVLNNEATARKEDTIGEVTYDSAEFLPLNESPYFKLMLFSISAFGISIGVLLANLLATGDLSISFASFSSLISLLGLSG